MGKHKTAADYLKLLKKQKKNPDFVPKGDKKKKKTKDQDSVRPKSPMVPMSDLRKMVIALSASRKPLFLHGVKNSDVVDALEKDRNFLIHDVENHVLQHSVGHLFEHPALLDEPGIILITDLNKHLKGEFATNEIMSLLWRTDYKAQLIGCVNVDKIDAHATMRAIHIHLAKEA